MKFDDYQQKAKSTAFYPGLGGQDWVYPALGLSGEAGEIANKLKKVIRDKKGRLTDEDKQVLKGELGDVLWYVSELSRQLGLSLEEVAQENIVKLASRAERGKLTGSGDNR